MKKHASSENSNAGVLFPFLAVLLCTMGALLVLLVVLAQRAGQRVVAEPAKPVPAAQPVVEIDTTEADELKRQLDEVRRLQKKLREYQEQAQQKVLEEKSRLSHLEDHSRRLEHELARLSLAAQQLEATEKNQSVDQQQAETELARLQELIEETQQQLDELRERATGEQSYAIVPYKGPNGTFRKPIYIECCKEGVILRPEGIRLVASDFAAAKMPGNPLAAAIRASQEYLNTRAANAGLPEPPDPYPLLIVRPEGIQQFYRARTAVTSWDSDYGYEFIGSDTKLAFPDLADPQLAQVQHHAILNAREQLAQLIRSAPRRFHAAGLGSGSSMASGGGNGSHGNGAGRYGESNGYGALAQSDEGELGNGSGSSHGIANGPSETPAGNEEGDYQFGAYAGNSGEGGEEAHGEFGEGSLAGGMRGQESSLNGNASGEAGSSGEQNPGQGGDSGNFAQAGGQAGGQSASGGSPGGPASSGSSAGSSAGGQSQGSTGTRNASNGQVKSIAESRGKNWAIEGKSRGAVPIRRPIQVVVRKNQLALLPSRHDRDGVGATGTLISLNQSTKQISDEFVEALRSRVDQWGLAGNGLYWRPVLELRIGPDAAQAARGVARLLQGSGVEVKISKSASLGPQVQALKGGRANATR